MKTLNIIYEHKITKKRYIRFEVDEQEEECWLYCNDDNSGKSDIKVSIEELNKNYNIVDSYEEEE